MGLLSSYAINRIGHLCLMHLSGVNCIVAVIIIIIIIIIIIVVVVVVVALVVAV